MSDAPAKRTLDNWVEGFMEYTSITPSPDSFRRWTAYSTIAGALERRVWTPIQGSELYPNMLILLVSLPGIGKSMAIKESQSILSSTGLFNLAPNGMTKAAFVDQLIAKLKYLNIKNKPTLVYNAMLVTATEFGTLFPDYDPTFLNVINDVYDCNPIFEDATRGGGLIKAERPHINMIAGTQPKYLGDLLPDSAFGMGFTSRMIMVFSGEEVVRKMFKKAKKPPKLRVDLISDLISIGNLAGEFDWTDEAKTFVEDWNENKKSDAPKHPKLQNYNTRRVMHAMKIAMAESASHSNDLLVTLEHMKFAKEFLLDAERLIPEIFKEMSSSQDASELDEIHEFLFNYCIKYDVETVPEHKLIHFISKKVAVNRINFFIEAMLTANMMKSDGLNLNGQRKFRPLRVSLYAK